MNDIRIENKILKQDNRQTSSNILRTVYRGVAKRHVTDNDDCTGTYKLKKELRSNGKAKDEQKQKKVEERTRALDDEPERRTRAKT